MLDLACRDVDEQLRTLPEFAHVSHLLVSVAGEVVFDAHYRGPVVADIFSVTKSVLATLVGIAVREGVVPDLDQPVAEILPIGRTPSAGQTLRHLLMMRRGSVVDGPYEIDEVMALPTGWIARIADAPLLEPPGTTFRYDNGASHLLGAALSRLLGTSLSTYAASRLFAPLGITQWHWTRDPEGFDLGFAHLKLSAPSLAALGRLWLQDGRCDGEQLVDPAFAQLMTSLQAGGGAPEGCGYGYELWVDSVGPFAGGWAGQHVTTVPGVDAVIVTTGDPRFEPGPPPTDQLQPGWRPARDLVVERLVPALLAALPRAD